MRSLYVRRLHLWPRFHVEVSEALDARQPDVEELTVPLSAKGAQLQRALLGAVDGCLAELRTQNAGVDVSQLTVENAIFKSFDVVVRRQLEPVWHRTSRRTKALVHDLATLRKLLGYLVRRALSLTLTLALALALTLAPTLTTPTPTPPDPNPRPRPR